jgi:oxygen-dependent protoporphyrinogen oxidase
MESALPELAVGLRRVTYNPVAVAVVQYDRPMFYHGYRAITFGREQEVTNIGAYGADEPDLVRYTFSGKTFRELFTEGTSSEEAISRGEKIIKTCTDLHVGRRIDSVYHYFKRGLTSYSPYHHRLLDQIERSTKGIEGLALCGDYISGFSIEACCQSAKMARDKIMREVALS